ncbi:13223_t:CDS:1 [Acaulospora colombiana]|uniref:13223_t:CDS:1 n=1 Tax=Acaulospora colombiana TaxID=27376 RepID=A0ACA9JXD7_9GLOM|nr:13223_t:CDS:1 [Acaulospora colombiana]
MPRESEIKIDDFITEPSEKIGKKCPNSFFVYRRVFTKELLRHNHRLEMANVSKMASIQWRNENPDIRKEYKHVAMKIGKKLKEFERGSSDTFCREFIHYNPPELHHSPEEIEKVEVL